MKSASEPESANAARIIPWVLWFAVTMGFSMIYVILGRRVDAAQSGLGLVGLAPLMASIVLRLFALPRMTSRARAIPLYIVCLATAEAGGMLGIFLGGPSRSLVIGAAFALLLMHNPAFALRDSDSNDRLRRVRP